MRSVDHKYQKGIVLIELVVAIAILSIAMLAIFALFSFGAKMFEKSSDTFEVQNDVRLSLIGSIDEFRYASELKTLSRSEVTNELADSSNKYTYLYLDGDKLYKSEYDETTTSRNISVLANNLDIANSYFEPIASDVLGVKLASSQSGEDYNIDKEVKLVNFSIEGKGAAISGGKNMAIRFKQNSYDDLLLTNNSTIYVNLSKSLLVMEPSSTYTLTATVANFTTDNSVVWSSTDPSIVSVTNGLVTSTGTLGTAIVKATSVEDSTKSASCAVSVELASIPIKVVYNGNGNSSGSVPIDSSSYAPGNTVTVLGINTLAKSGYVFNGWNTLADGSGTVYSIGSTFTIGATDVNLYAQWRAQHTLVQLVNDYTYTILNPTKDHPIIKVVPTTMSLDLATITISGGSNSGATISYNTTSNEGTVGRANSQERTVSLTITASRSGENTVTRTITFKIPEDIDNHVDGGNAAVIMLSDSTVTN